MRSVFSECVIAEFSVRPASEPRRINQICTTSPNYPEIVIRDPFGPMKTKGLRRLQHELDALKRVTRTEGKGRMVTLESKDIYPLGVQNVS